MKVKYKLLFSLIFSIFWVAFSIIVGWSWIQDLRDVFGPVLGVVVFCGIAGIPGWAMSFTVFSLILDSRPYYKFKKIEDYPRVSIIIPTYNEGKNITKTILSVIHQKYPSAVQIIVSDDGSSDDTTERVKTLQQRYENVELIESDRNIGKYNALNKGLGQSKNDIVISLDGDSLLFRNALENIVSHLVLSEPEVKAVAGSIMSRNHKKNILTRMQQWDYYYGISVIKRVQSLYQGALVAQGAFSAYYKNILLELDGWKNCFGEDIVLTWGIHSLGYKVHHAEAAICFTSTPDTIKKFVRQRARWSKGLVEAFMHYPRSLVQKKKNIPFIWYNTTFPFLDFSYIFFFVPGVVAAIFFQYYAIAGLYTLFLLPLAAILLLVYTKEQHKLMVRAGLVEKIDFKRIVGLLSFVFIYQPLLAFSSFTGFVEYAIGINKKWN